jgi:predicted nuclease of predicted toxin-antitoxin system
VNLLLDENLDWRLSRHLPGHVVESVALIGWAGLKNGALLEAAAKRFDVLVTMDGHMVHQQNLRKYSIAVIALRARSNRLADTQPLMPKVLVVLPMVQAGTLTIVS